MIRELVLWFGVALLGIPAHEVAHWLVWRVTGRNPKIGIRVVRPRDGPRISMWYDRVAAAAPYVAGGLSIAGGVGFGEVLAIIFGASMIARPSRIDFYAILGRVDWDIE